MNPPSTDKPALVAIVDDEQDITTFLGLALEDHGYRVVTINDAGNSLTALRDQPPDLICLDLLMPHRTGASLFKEIRSDSCLANVPVLILSGLNASEDLSEILGIETDDEPTIDYLEKPIVRDTFLETVASLLARDETKGGRQ